MAYVTSLAQMNPGKIGFFSRIFGPVMICPQGCAKNQEVVNVSGHI